MVGGLKVLTVVQGREQEFETLFAELRNEMRTHEPGCILYSLLKSRKNPRAYIVQEPGHGAIFGRAIEAAHAAVAIDQHESRGVSHAAIHVAELEPVAAEGFERRLIAGEEEPAARFSMVSRGIGCEHRWFVVLWIDREGNQRHPRHVFDRALHAAHLGAHARAWAGTIRINEIGHPDMAIERFAVEWLARL